MTQYSFQAGAPAAAKPLLEAVANSLKQADPKTAAAKCRPLIERFPKLAEAHFMVGLTATELKDLPNAIRGLKMALTINRQYTAAWIQLARVFAMAGAFDDSQKALQQALDLKPQAAPLLDMVATVYALLGLTQQSYNWVCKARDAFNEAGGVPVAIKLNVARAAGFMGQTDEARAALNDSIDDPVHGPEALWMRARLKGANATRELQAIEDTLKRPDLNAQQSAWLFSAQGSLLEQVGDYTAAWQSFSHAADAKRTTRQYSLQDDLKGLQQLQEAFSDDWWQQNGTDTADGSEGPIFIIGLPRTGSTLLEQMIGSHSAVEALGELQQWPVLVRNTLRERGRLKATPPDKLGTAYLETVAYRRRDKPFFTDKLPTNFRYAPLIAAALPQARIIHIRRHPLDASVAIYKHMFADAYPWSYDLDELAEYYCAYHKLMDHYRAIMGPRLIEISYEELVKNPASHISNLLNRLGLPEEEGVLNFKASSVPVTTASAAQVREKPHSRSVDRWKMYQEGLTEVIKSLEHAQIPFT